MTIGKTDVRNPIEIRGLELYALPTSDARRPCTDIPCIRASGWFREDLFSKLTGSAASFPSSRSGGTSSRAPAADLVPAGPLVGFGLGPRALGAFTNALSGVEALPVPELMVVPGHQSTM